MLPFGILITETLSLKDNGKLHASFEAEKVKEIKGLIDRGTCKAILKRDIPDDGNILSSRIVLTIKIVKTNNPIFKEKLFVHGYKNQDKPILMHDSTKLRQLSTKLIAPIGVSFKFKIWSHD